MTNINAESLIKAGFTPEQVIALVQAQNSGSKKHITNTSHSVLSEPNGAKHSKDMQEHFGKENKVPVTIAQPYGKMTGGIVKVSINGVWYHQKADGKEYMVNESHAAAIKQRLKNLDLMESEKGIINTADYRAGVSINTELTRVGEKIRYE